LLHAQENYSECGAAEKRKVTEAREPLSEERRDDEWRPIDPQKDNIEIPARGLDYKNSYPEDTTVLYYWRQNYWRKLVS
jgi:hypothetical protein